MSFPKRDETKPAEEQGLFDKFTVIRNDGSDRPGGKHHGCRYFVLDIDHDPWAVPALLAYSDVCRSTHPYLADDLLRMCGGEAALEQRKPVQEKLRDARNRLDAIERELRDFIKARKVSAAHNRRCSKNVFLGPAYRNRLKGMAEAREVDMRLLRTIVDAPDAVGED